MLHSCRFLPYRFIFQGRILFTAGIKIFSSALDGIDKTGQTETIYTINRKYECLNVERLTHQSLAVRGSDPPQHLHFLDQRHFKYLLTPLSLFPNYLECL
jgi:hypothetical protein